MLTEGFIIMVIGMAVVFLFLGILVAIMYASRYFIKYLPIENQSASAEIIASREPTPEEIAVAVAAIKKFKLK